MSQNVDIEYARKKIELARLEESEICPVVQSLTIQDGQEDICLLQLNKEIAAGLFEGDTLIIRGDLEDPAVLCTNKTTYELKEAETSNSLLLMPEMQWPENCQESSLKVVPQNISGIFHTYYELRELKPSFKKLRAILEGNSYKGKEYEADENVQNYTFEMLLDVIQASAEELKAEIIRMQTCNINGHVRVLDFDYKFNVFSSILNVIESRSIPLDKIPKDPVIETLEDLEPKEILELCFSWFTKATGEVDENGNQLHTLVEELVCKLYAEVLLRSSGKFRLHDFLESWQRSVPEGMKCDLEQLRGMALTDTNSMPAVIFYFPPDNLSENIKERFEHLFKIKDKWWYDDIVPYLEDRASPGNDVKALLIKYTRESTKESKKMYSSKW
ncbi:hypothetical protein JTE90_026575 [Oedothorax gibbosus]|uniref:Sister chromatid cohesion protein DCC1 n=1 Tax=Oedothorax gibbosus TaxID=931172 RepID=A0AAV6U1C3_9ARAC|nr:hypothetical protein JTE90_026575 [Oedothorax gibbosus]